MANRKSKPCEDWEFLPIRLQESTKLDISEKNVVATLCFYRLNYSNYATEHNGWFYTSLNEIAEGSKMSLAQTKRVLLKLSVKKVIERKSGTNHRCTHYKLHPKIDELLPIIEVNEPLAINEELKTTNEPLVEKTKEIEVNEPLDKIREVKKRQEKSFLITSTSISIVDEKEKEERTSFSNHQQFNSREFYYKWIECFKLCKTEDELIECFKKASFELPSDCEYLKNDTYIETLQDEYSRLRAHLHWKKTK